MIYKIANLLSVSAAVGLSEVSDYMSQPSWDSFMEREEKVYNWFEYENSSIKSNNGGTIYFLNVTSLEWLDESKAYGPNGNNIWSHHVAINIPNNLKYTNVSTAYVTGDCNENDSDLPTADSAKIQFSDDLAFNSQMISITIF